MTSFMEFMNKGGEKGGSKDYILLICSLLFLIFRYAATNVTLNEASSQTDLQYTSDGPTAQYV